MSSSSQSSAAILLDIEGTTTPIDFVYEVLFPYARTHVGDYLSRRVSSSDVRSDIASLIEENRQDACRGLQPSIISPSPEQDSIESIVAYVHWMMVRDRKSTALKSLQGKIWEEGYNSGDLRSCVFEDVPRALKRWREQVRKVAIYSSGSVLAQKLLFAHTESGDLTGFIEGFFDTNVGPKREAESYRRISATLDLQPSAITFVSDVVAELDAAAAAGLRAILCARRGNPPQPANSHPIIRSFDEIA